MIHTPGHALNVPSRRFGSHPRWAASAALVLTLLAAPGIWGAGTPGASAEPVPEGETADSAALAHYESGMANKTRAWEHERAAQSAEDPERRAAELAAAEDAYGAAITDFGKALKLHLNYYQAANELGYALRKTGNYRKALGAYNFALTIKPDFYPAVEYRGEAYLALGLFDEAKDAYMTLFRNEPVLAAQLLEAMAAAADADDTSAGEAFAAWVAERQQLAELAELPEAAAADW